MQWIECAKEMPSNVISIWFMLQAQTQLLPSLQQCGISQMVEDGTGLLITGFGQLLIGCPCHLLRRRMKYEHERRYNWLD